MRFRLDYGGYLCVGLVSDGRALILLELCMGRALVAEVIVLVSLNL